MVATKWQIIQMKIVVNVCKIEPQNRTLSMYLLVFSCINLFKVCTRKEAPIDTILIFASLQAI